MKTHFIIIDGPMGSGKTTIAEALHPKLKRTAMLGSDRIKWFVSDFRRTKEDNRIAREVVLAMCEAYLRNGISVLVPQGFMQPASREPYLKLARKMKCQLIQYRLTAPRDVLLARLGKRPKAALAHKPVPKTRILRNLRLHAKHHYEGAALIDTSEVSPSKAVDLILRDLKKR